MNHTTGQPRGPIKRNQNQILQQILQPTYISQVSTTGLFFEILDLPLSELETKKVLKVTWLSDGIAASETLDLLVPKNGQVHDLIEALQKRVGFDDETASAIRVYESHSGKFLKALSNEFAVIGITDYVDVFAEKIPEEELPPKVEETDRLLNAFHFYREPVKVHTRGIPFKFVVKNVIPTSAGGSRYAY